MRRTAVPAAFALAVLAACSPDGTTPPPGADAGPEPTPDAPRPPGVVTRSVAIERVAVERDREATICVNIPADISEDMLLVGIRTHLSEGSHHMIVSRADEVTPGGTPFLCAPFRHGIGDTLFIAQQAEAGFDFPEGSGLYMNAGQPIGLELHFVNYVSDSPIDITGTVELDFAPLPETFRPVHIAFLGNLSLDIPPRETTVETYDYTPAEGAEILAVTSHTHQLGVLSTIDLVTPDGSTPIHESRSWADPPLDVFDPPLVIGVSDHLHLECTYDNTTDHTVGFGEDFEDEMCFLWAYYLEP